VLRQLLLQLGQQLATSWPNRQLFLLLLLVLSIRSECLIQPERFFLPFWRDIFIHKARELLGLWSHELVSGLKLVLAGWLLVRAVGRLKSRNMENNQNYQKYQNGREVSLSASVIVLFPFGVRQLQAHRQSAALSHSLAALRSPKDSHTTGAHPFRCGAASANSARQTRSSRLALSNGPGRKCLRNYHRLATLTGTKHERLNRPGKGLARCLL